MSRESASRSCRLEMARRGVDPEFSGLPIPIELLGCGEQVIERDAAGERPGEGMPQDLWAKLCEWEQLQDARAGDILLLGEDPDLESGLDEVIVPAIRQTDRIHEVLPGFRLRRDDQVMAVGAEEQPTTIELLDLELQFQLDVLASVIDLGRSQANRSRGNLLGW